MASPPFDINQALPADSDIVSQHPFNARAFRDIVESWLLINHDVNGNHFRIDIPRSASPATPVSPNEVLYASLTGRLKIKHQDGTEEFVGVPPGAIVYSSASLDTGYLDADGSAVSRAAFPDLFAKISTNYGIGNGTTTFNLPNLKGRLIAGYDAAGSLITTANGGLDTTTLGAIGGVPNFTLVTANLPPYTPAGSLSVTSTVANIGQGGNTGDFSVGSGGAAAFSAFTVGTRVNSAVTSTGTLGGTAQGGVSTAVKTVPPAIVLRAMIKY